MDLISLVVTLIVIGLILYLLQLLPIDATIKQLIHGVIIVVVIVWLLSLVLPFFPWRVPIRK